MAEVKSVLRLPKEQLQAEVGNVVAATVNLAKVNPYIFQLEQKPKAILSHELGAGSPCLKCRNECIGLDLHFWRKICKNCYCRLDEHDIVLPSNLDHGEFVIKKLFGVNDNKYVKYNSQPINDLHIKLKPIINRTHKNNGGCLNHCENDENKKQENFPSRDIVEKLRHIHLNAAAAEANNLAQHNEFQQKQQNSNKSLDNLCNFNLQEYNNGNNFVSLSEYTFISAKPTKLLEEQKIGNEYAWVPAGEHFLVERYMSCLPLIERPLLGTQGAQFRRQRLAYQLPYHDCDSRAAKSLQNDDERELHRKFVEFVKDNAVGIGEIIDFKQHYANNKNGNNQNENFVCVSYADDKLVQTQNDNLNCKTCTKGFNSNEVGIITDHGTINEVWHPECFRCDFCHQLLADLLYFYKNGQYFCGRHFGESIYPRCNGCDELIFAKEYTFAEEMPWHVDHFCCFGCDLHLGGHRYITKKEKAYCIDCYMLKFAKNCLFCKCKIAPFESRISHKDFHWHANDNCFKCKVCAKVLTNQKFSLKNENIFCSLDCSKKY